MKLYEFQLLFGANVVIAAKSEKAARKRAEGLTVDEIRDEFNKEGGVDDFYRIGEIDEPDIRDIVEDVKCEAHFVVEE